MKRLRLTKPSAWAPCTQLQEPSSSRLAFSWQHSPWPLPQWSLGLLQADGRRPSGLMAAMLLTPMSQTPQAPLHCTANSKILLEHSFEPPLDCAFLKGERGFLSFGPICCLMKTSQPQSERSLFTQWLNTHCIASIVDQDTAGHALPPLLWR